MIQQQPEEGKTNEVKQGVTEIEDMETLKKILAEEKEKAEGYLVNWQRAQTDFINYKRRSEQEKEEISKFASGVFMLNLLPILDDLERALASIPPKLTGFTWVEGISLIERKLRASLETKGLSQIKALGEPFDPNLHEAAMHSKGKEGIVIEELQKGYKLHDRVIRPTMVVVGNGEEEEKEE
ncbi:MAG: nucleotide exchange factor GrpE [Chloroflexi bacterium]|nr:nucleotide exchange factor GrpE [Chloroflexota bacterium]